jgi:hypothetical protein
MKMRLILIFIYGIFLANVFLCVASCASHKNVPKSVTSTANHSFPSGISASSQFRFLWDELHSELGTSDLGRFVPSKSFVAKFHLQYSEGKYLVSGFLHVDDDFHPDDIKVIGGVASRYSNKIYSFHVPLSQVFKLVLIEGVKRIETGTKVFTK